VIYCAAVARPLSWDTLEFAGAWTIFLVVGAFLLVALLFFV
jgi:hypothetical protein